MKSESCRKSSGIDLFVAAVAEEEKSFFNSFFGTGSEPGCVAAIISQQHQLKACDHCGYAGNMETCPDCGYPCETVSVESLN